MNQKTHERSSTGKVSLWKMAGAAVALGGLSGVVLAEGSSEWRSERCRVHDEERETGHDLGEWEDCLHLEGE